MVFKKLPYGTLDFDRLDWKRLVADIEAGKVATVLVKDMNRVGRNCLQTGLHTEVFFREHGVHFIAIANNADNEDQSSSEFAPFLNIVRWTCPKHKPAISGAALTPDMAKQSQHIFWELFTSLSIVN